MKLKHPNKPHAAEVEEETGYQITDLEKIAGAYTSAGGITEYVAPVYCPLWIRP